jgi:hypothetical protein
MNILVDYNNVPLADQNRGPSFVINKIINTLGFHLIQPHLRINFRLYDGWYEEHFLTRRAQFVSSEILNDFPSTRTLIDGTNKHKIIVNAELAYSLRIDPGRHLWHTFRKRGYPSNLRCHNPIHTGCTASPCQMAATYSFLANQICPELGCGVRPEDLIFRGEQKLVDSMLSVDLIYSHLQGESQVAIVSSDDDMWPSIKTNLQLGMSIIHIHTIPNRRTPSHYSTGPKGSYIQCNL